MNRIVSMPVRRVRGASAGTAAPDSAGRLAEQAVAVQRQVEAGQQRPLGGQVPVPVVRPAASSGARSGESPTW